MLNKCMFIGNLTRDPEIRYLADGTAVANFTIACSERWKDKKTGEKKESTEFIRVVAWRRLGEIVSEFLSKGKMVYIEGKLQTRDWQDKDGNKRYTTEIVANQMQMLGGGESRGDTGKPDFGVHDQSQSEEDIPF